MNNLNNINSDDSQLVYLDYAATAPMCEEACLAMKPFVSSFGFESLPFRGNANSLYSLGREANSYLETAKRDLSRCLHAKRPSEIVFTASSTESIFLALSGLFAANGCKTIITTEIEHPAVLQAANHVAGKKNVVLLKVNKHGFVSNDELAAAIKNAENPLVSVQMANSELASVQDIAQLVSVAHGLGCIFHCDMTQAFGKVPVDLEKLDVDSASFSSHKIGGPQGVGALYLKNSVGFSSPMIGGGQENKRRGGTQNVCGAVGFAAAAKACVANLDEEVKRLQEFKDFIVDNLSKMTTSANKSVRLVVDEKAGLNENPACSYLPNIATFIVGGVESETLILRLDDRQISVAGGSACSTGSVTVSKSLKAVGISDDDGMCELRVSFGRYTTKDDITSFVNSFKEVI